MKHYHFKNLKMSHQLNHWFHWWIPKGWNVNVLQQRKWKRKCIFVQALRKNTCAISNHLSCLQRALCASSLENINLHSTGQHTDPLTAPFPRRVPLFSLQMALVPPHLLYIEVLQCSCQGNGRTSAQPNAAEESWVLTYFWQRESLRSFQSLLLVT